ncbi:Uncharacterised protein [Chlamydia abortus]|nr:Uncharacterised protein [Chlamydia abortus]
MFLIFHDFQFSCHIQCPTVDISKFSTFFSFPPQFHVLKLCISHFHTVFLDIFHVLKCVFLIFRAFQFSRHIPGPSVCICHFSVFSDLVIFQVVKWMFLIFHDFQFSGHIPRPKVDISKFSTFFSFPCHISRPKVCIFLIFRDFQFSRHIPGPSVAFLIFHVF